MKNNVKNIFEIKNDQQNVENVNLLEIGNVTELTLGNMHYDYERIRYYSDGSCTILKK
jgi:hypothetical protein